MGPNFLLHQPVQNQILAALPEAELQQLRPHLTPVRVVPRQVLIDHGQKTEHAFFIEEGIVSVIDEDGTQVAMVGSEGLVGCQALLDIDIGSFAASVVQIPGPALRIRFDHLQRMLDVCPTLQRLCMGSVKALMEQTMQTAACNARNTIAERCVRWLLMTHDRIDGDELPITHEVLAGLLAVRRAGVTVVVAGLQDAGLVRVNRGRITILDRTGLEHQIEKTRWTVASDFPQHPTLRSVGSSGGQAAWRTAA